MDIRLGELGLEVQAADPRQPDVEHQATCDIRKLALQQLRGGSKRLGLQAHRSKEITERSAHRVVNDEHDRLGFGRFCHHSPPYLATIGLRSKLDPHFSQNESRLRLSSPSIALLPEPPRQQRLHHDTLSRCGGKVNWKVAPDP